MKQYIFIKPSLSKEEHAGFISTVSLKVFSDRIKKYYHAGEYGWNLDINITNDMKQWIEDGQQKSIIESNDIDFDNMLKTSREKNIPFAKIDNTCVAIGPCSDSIIDSIIR